MYHKMVRIILIIWVITLFSTAGSGMVTAKADLDNATSSSNSQTQLEGEDLTFRVFLPLISKPQQEWLFHKTADNLHPDGNEQQLVWLMNRARANPTQEGIWLATTTEPDIAGGRTYFGVNTALLQSEFTSYAIKPPAAFDVRMYQAALAHSQDLIVRDAQDHIDQFKRIEDAGFQCWSGRGNVFSYAGSALNAHGAFNIDWGGTDGTGMQTGRGHRMAIMSVDGNYTNVGFAMVYEGNPETNVGPLVTTQNFCYASVSATNHFNRFVVGTVWQDHNANDRYDPGEGIGNVTITPDRGAYYAITAHSGGYAIPIEAAGVYTLTFSGAVEAYEQVTIADVSVLVDLQVPGVMTDNILMPTSGSVLFPELAPPPGIQFPFVTRNVGP